MSLGGEPKLLEQAFIVKVVACEHAQQPPQDRRLQVRKAVKLVDDAPHAKGEAAQPAIHSPGGLWVDEGHHAKRFICLHWMILAEAFPHVLRRGLWLKAFRRCFAELCLSAL